MQKVESSVPSSASKTPENRCVSGRSRWLHLPKRSPTSERHIYVPLADLVARARGLQRAFADLQIELIEAPGRVMIVFWQRGRHVGPLETPLGEISPAGREVDVRVIDVLSITEARISAIQIVPDNLELAMQLGAVQLAQRSESP
jgi:hypothetical protein